MPGPRDAPNFDLRSVTLADVRHLFVENHAYRSAGRVAVYAFAVFEDDLPVAAYAWQPPAPGAAKSVCPALPAGVLALSRMVAVPREERRLRHVSKPLRHQMLREIDRVRWPVLVTYSDESVGHTGHVYRCSGWTPTTRRRVNTRTVGGARVSQYSNGVTLAPPEGSILGHAWLQRWEHRVSGVDDATAAARFAEAYARVLTGRAYRSGKPAYRYVSRADAAADPLDGSAGSPAGF